MKVEMKIAKFFLKMVHSRTVALHATRVITFLNATTSGKSIYI